MGILGCEYAPLVQRQRHVCLLASTNVGSGSGDVFWLAISVSHVTHISFRIRYMAGYVIAFPRKSNSG
jgi:hypothetical protein